MNWDQSLDVGVEAMNKEHREILDAMNKIFDAHQAGKKGDMINRLVARLGEICVRHFADEEKYMFETHYDGLERHKLIHQTLLKDFGVHAESI